ncbi:MAG: FosX/FosE/FosI family fosfomycin resistance hydrolase [Hyphomicrobiaceae bacterium]|nr:FosX/FosE/FosI family fosfomycin resistance hydrolase [Hyphomicrobiaceae bacterium]
MPATSGLSHITLICRDLDRMEEILIGVMGAQKLYDSGAEGFSIAEERFYDIGGVWLAVMKGESLAARSYNHIAFKVTDDDLDAARTAIERLGLELRPPRPRVPGEGRSLYFYDADNHLFELHTGTLEERLARYHQGKA